MMKNKHLILMLYSKKVNHAVHITVNIYSNANIFSQEKNKIGVQLHVSWALR